MSASQNGHKEIVELLIEKTVPRWRPLPEVDRVKPMDGRLLCWQAKTDTRRVVELLIEKGARVDLATKPMGGRLLCRQASNGHKGGREATA